MADDDASLTEFEQMYRVFIRKGGFRAPCVAEDVQRREAARTTQKPSPCPHGLTRLTCSICYLNDSNGYLR